MSTTTYSNSERQKTTGVPTTGLSSGAPAKSLLHVSYEVVLNTPAVAATLYLVLRWRDREGALRTHAAGAVGLLGSASTRAVVPIWVEDSGDQGAQVEYEIQTLGVLGSTTYNYWVAVEQIDVGV